MRLVVWQHGKPHITDPLFATALALLVGGIAGFLAILAIQASAKWSMVIVLLSTIPAITLLFNDLRKIVLLAFIIDIPLGLDIVVPDRVAPDGQRYMVSLKTWD
jgi:hypothetical protein